MSGESILADPVRQNIELRQVPFRTVAMPGGAWVQVADPDPQRMTLTVVGIVNWGDYVLSPAGVGFPSVASAVAPLTPTVIHATAFPLLISGQWWAFSTFAQTLLVWDVTC